MARRLPLLLLLSLGLVARAAEPEVQLLLPSRTLEPKSTFEVRFAREMVPADQIGKAAAVSPLIFQPAVEGSFVWLSTRSGSFAPSAILPLGTKFQISIAKGLKDAAGKEVGVKFRETAETPPMRLKGGYQLSARDSENAPVLPAFMLLFNANVRAADAAKFIRYEDAARLRIPARVEQAGQPTDRERERSFSKYESDDRSLDAWTAEPAPSPTPEPDAESEEDDALAPDPKKPEPPRGNILFVAPTKPLPPGKGWRLIVEKGMPAAEWKTALPLPQEYPIGSVLPFAPKTITPESNHIDGRRIMLEFPKMLAAEVDNESVGRWIKVQPAPANLTARVHGGMVTLRGDFELGPRYRVTVLPGLPAREPTETIAATTQEVAFEKIPSRLYFSDFAAHQYAGGSRQLRLVSVNVPRVRISARLFTGEAVAAAVKAFDKYQDTPEDEPDEYYSRVDVDALPGEAIWQKDFESGGATDAEQVIALNWDEVVGANRTGTILFTAESLDPLTENAKRVGSQTLLQLTDIGATWKRDRDAYSLHLFSMASGKALSGAKLQLVDTETSPLAEATTDADGNAKLPNIDETRWVFARTANDAHLIAITSGEGDVPLYRMGVTEDMSAMDEEGRSARTIFLFTERGVYKPGDRLYLKGYAQDARPDHPRIPAGKPVTITITDSKERQIFTNKVILSEFGSFDQEVTLPEGSLGRYQVVALGEKGEQLGGSVSFQVQEYKPNAFEVLIPKPPETTGDTQLALPITAKYFMGKPLAKAKLIWSLVARDQAFAPEGLDDFAFCNAITDYRLNRTLDRVSQFNAQGDVPIAENGIATVATALPVNPKAPQPRAAKLLCEVTDLNQQTVSESRSFVQHASDFYLGLRRADYVLKEGAPLPVELIAVRPDGKPLDQATRATVRLTRINWQTNRLATAGNSSEFESKANLQVVWERELATVPGLDDTRKPNVTRLEDVVAGKPGDYLLEAIAKDASGHHVLTSLSFEVSGDAEMDWNYRNPYVIDVVADKDSYEPGETARLLVKTPIAGNALVSVERDRVLRSFIVPLTGNAPSVQIPIEENDGPNVYASVMVLRGGDESPRKIKTPEYRVGYANLKVGRPKDKLAVTVKPTAPAARPGEKVQIDAEIRRWNREPAADAEVTLYAVDEGVLSLTGYETPDPLAFFNEPRGIGVTTSLTIPTLLKEDLAESEFANKGYLVGDGKGGPALLGGLRKNFLATAFWNATLRTDAQGRVRAEFTAPDSLTRYRIIAVAITKEGALGGAQSAFEINKPIMIESAMPAFANVGDKLVMRAVAHNTTAIPGKAEVELRVDGTARAATARQLIDLPPQSTQAIDIPIEVIAPGAARWSWSIRFNGADKTAELRDAVEATIKINHPAPLIHQVETRRVDGNSAELLRISDPQILEGSGEVTVNLSNTRVLELRESLRYLLHYPYGCVEQTTSNMLPWLTVRDLRATLPELAKSDAEVANAVNGGIRLLLSMQTSGGGLSYWPKGREPMLWGSAYGGLALTLAKQQGFAVPEAEYKRLFKYLSEQLRGMARDATGYGLSDRCLAVYTLAMGGAPEPGYHDLLFQKRAKLSPEDRALVALAIIESKGPKQMIDELLKVPSAGPNYIEQWFGSLARENALHLLAWTLTQPKSPRVDQLALELFARRHNGHWTTTQSNAWSLLALSSYLRRVETGPRESSGTVAWADASKPFTLTTDEPATSSVFALNPAVAPAPITLAKTGGQVFSEVRVAARSRLIEHPQQDQGYRLTRRYAKIGDDGRLGAAENLRVGDRVLVTLDVEARRRATYIALDDPLPGVLAPINPAFRSQEVLAGESLGREWVSDYSELRQDRAVFFADQMNPGRYTLRYLARVVCAGDVIAPSAKIEEMYHPERFGTTETMRISAQPLE